MQMHWDELTFLHWPVDQAVIQATLPPGLRAQTFGGSAWISLVPFVMRITLPHAPVAPWLGRFPETNVRTYVTVDRRADERRGDPRLADPDGTDGPDGPDGPDGTDDPDGDADPSEGIWFYSLDASRAAAVGFARASYRLPYIWSAMTVERARDTIVYRCRRRTGAHATSEVAVRIGDRYGADQLSGLDHFLTARWRLYSVIAGRTIAAPARHDAWPLQRAELLHLDDGLVVADGLPAPIGPPIVHFAESVSVRVGTPHRPS